MDKLITTIKGKYKTLLKWGLILYIADWVCAIIILTVCAAIASNK